MVCYGFPAMAALDHSSPVRERVIMKTPGQLMKRLDAVSNAAFELYCKADDDVNEAVQYKVWGENSLHVLQGMVKNSRERAHAMFIKIDNLLLDLERDNEFHKREARFKRESQTQNDADAKTAKPQQTEQQRQQQAGEHRAPRAAADRADRGPGERSRSPRRSANASAASSRADGPDGPDRVQHLRQALQNKKDKGKGRGQHMEKDRGQHMEKDKGSRARGEGQGPARGEGQGPARGEGHGPARGQGQGPARGEGHRPARGEGHGPAHGEGQEAAEAAPRAGSGKRKRKPS